MSDRYAKITTCCECPHHNWLDKECTLSERSLRGAQSEDPPRWCELPVAIEAPPGVELKLRNHATRSTLGAAGMYSTAPCPLPVEVGAGELDAPEVESAVEEVHDTLLHGWGGQ